MEKTHWKKLYNPNYLGAYAFLPNEQKTLTISKVLVESVTGADGKSEECTVIHFAQDEKPLICNKTNAKAIASVTGSDYIEDWIGQDITLLTKQVRAFGDMVDAVRVDHRKPKPKKVEKELMTVKHPAFDKALKAIESGQYTVKAVQSKYALDADALTKLKAAENV